MGTHKREVGSFAHQSFIEGGLEREIKGLERFAFRKMSRFAPILMGGVCACFHFQRKHAPQKGIVGEAMNACLFHEMSQLRFHVRSEERRVGKECRSRW